MIPLDEKQRRFLSALVERGGSATSKELGGYTVDGSNARRMCSLRRLASYEGTASHNGTWTITEDGLKALQQTPEE